MKNKKALIYLFLSITFIYMSINPTHLSARDFKTTSAKYNSWNLYTGTSDITLKFSEGLSKKKISAFQYGLSLNLEEKIEKWESELSFARFNCSELKGVYLGAKIGYLPFKHSKKTLFSRLSPSIGCTLCYHFTRLRVQDHTEDQDSIFYQQNLRGLGIEPTLALKTSLFNKALLWRIELGPGVYSYRADLIEESQKISTSGISFILDSKISKKIYNTNIELGYKYKNLKIDNKYMSNSEQQIYPSLNFIHHLFYFNLSYIF